jgi:hypothetical protein
VIEGFNGTIVEPGAAEYDAARAVWNAMHDRRPALIVRPESTPDVAAAIRYARARRSVTAWSSRPRWCRTPARAGSRSAAASGG